MDDHVVVGRDEELALLDRFTANGSAEPPVLLLEGEAGLGKTTLVESGVGLAIGRSFRVLRSSPAESEARLSFSALTDLIDEVLDETLPEIPPARAHALETALMRSTGSRADPRGVALGTLDVLSALSATGSMLVAVDDWQWVDPASAQALTFAIRRLKPDSARVLSSVRIEEGVPSALRQVPAGLVRRIQVRPLEPVALHALLRDRLGLTVSHPVLARIHNATGGNPFFALQLGEALCESGDAVLAAELPIPADVQALLHQRLNGFGEETKQVLRAMAVLRAPTVTALEAVLGDADRARAGIDRALEVGVLRLEGDQARLDHPLIGTAVLAATTPQEIRGLHRAAARLSSDPEDRARHLALAADGTDQRLAAALDTAAQHAADRGASAAAAELSDLALRATSASDIHGRVHRTLAAADRHQRAGDGARATAMLDELVSVLPAGPQRAAALDELAATIAGDTPRTAALLEQALKEAGDDRRLRARIHWTLAAVRGSLGDQDLSEHHGQVAVDLAGQAGDDGLLADALTILGLQLAAGGAGVQRDLMTRALEAATRGTPRYLEDPEWTFGLMLLHAGEIEEAAPLLDRALQKAVDSGDMESQCRALSLLGEFEVRRGDWEAADRYTAETVDLAEQIAISNLEPMTLYHRSLVEAHLGAIEHAREHAERCVECSAAMEDAYFEALAQSVLGFIAISVGDAEAAAQRLDALTEQFPLFVARDPNFLPIRALSAEALVMAGDPQRAAVTVGALKEDATRLGHDWALALVDRCKGLISAAEGDFDMAITACDRSIGRHAELKLPFDLARTFLVKGVIQRRSKLKRPARETLERASGIFQRLGASLWLQRTESELKRIGGRRPTTGKALTDTEERIAQLAAAGRSNRQIAAELYLSERSVEANLTRVYRKLGLRSRVELAATGLQRADDRSASRAS